MSSLRKHEVIIKVYKDEVILYADDGGEIDDKFIIDSLWLPTINIFAEWIRFNKISRREELEVLGSHLFKALFSDKIWNFVKERLTKAKNEGERLRLLLTFKGKHIDLINLPWEYLYGPEEGGDFLASSVDLALARFIPLESERKDLLPDKHKPMKILVIVSEPEDKNSVMSKEVLEKLDALKEGTKDRELAVKIEVDTFWEPTEDNISEQIKKSKPHILHFIGHGQYNEKTHRGEIYFLDPIHKKFATPIDYKLLIECFEIAKVFPRLVFLQMCEGGKAESEYWSIDAFSGFAPHLISKGIPAVVAMKYPIKNKDASEFFSSFYLHLADGRTVDGAVQKGRKMIGFRNRFDNRVFGTPVLYMQSSDGVIMPREIKDISDSLVDRACEEELSRTDPIDTKKHYEIKNIDANNVQPKELFNSRSSFVQNIKDAGLNKLKTFDLSDKQNIEITKLVCYIEDNIINNKLSDISAFLFDLWQNEKNGINKKIIEVMILTNIINIGSESVSDFSYKFSQQTDLFEQFYDLRQKLLEQCADCGPAEIVKILMKYKDQYEDPDIKKVISIMIDAVI